MEKYAPKAKDLALGTSSVKTSIRKPFGRVISGISNA
jgi:hypothetical protein